jgi:hypothetical protein
VTSVPGDLMLDAGLAIGGVRVQVGESARDQIIQGAGIIADTVIELVGTIGRAVLELMPARRLRVSPRAVKRPLSRYAYKSLKADRRTYKATLGFNILTPTISP